MGPLTRRLPAVLREEPQFRLLFWGQAFSLLGDRITFVVLPFAVLAAGGGVTDVGIVAAAQTLPFLVFSLLAGVWADRVDRRRIMIASDLLRLACQATAGVLLIAGAAEPWHLAVLAFLFGAGDAFFAPALVGLLPQIVPPERLQAANALRGLTHSSGLVLGPALAALLVAVAGTGAALLVDAATFAISVGCLIPLRPAAVERLESEQGQDLLAGLRGGWREVRQRPWVVRFLGAMGVYHVVVLPSIFVLGPVLADRELGGPEAWAPITAAFGLGSIIGDAILLRWRPGRPLLAAAACLIGGSCQAAIIGSGLPVAGIAGLECLAGICVTCFFTLWETTLQEQVPERAISRVASYDMLISVGLMPVGTLLAGPIAETAGLQTTLVWMSVIGVASALACLASPSVRRLARPG